MGKRFILTLIIMAVLFAPLWAQSESDFAVTLTADGQGVVITRYNGTIADVRIPATIQGMPVREIAASAFEAVSRGTLITSVEIPEGVTYIGANAFSHNRMLRSVNIPNSVRVIREFTFEGCIALNNITLHDGLESIEQRAFMRTGLTSVTWPAGVTSIPYAVFSGSQALQSVTIPEGVTSIGPSAFSSSGLTSITLPSTIEEIHADAFRACSSLVTVSIPETVTSINFMWVGRIRSDNDAFIHSSNINLASQAALRRVGYTGSF